MANVSSPAFQIAQHFGMVFHGINMDNLLGFLALIITTNASL
jgi:hypothetical protein